MTGNDDAPDEQLPSLAAPPADDDPSAPDGARTGAPSDPPAAGAADASDAAGGAPVPEDGIPDDVPMQGRDASADGSPDGASSVSVDTAAPAGAIPSDSPVGAEGEGGASARSAGCGGPDDDPWADGGSLFDAASGRLFGGDTEPLFEMTRARPAPAAARPPGNTLDASVSRDDVSASVADPLDASGQRSREDDAAARLRTLLATVGREPTVRVATANLPVHRASTVLFDTLAQAEAAGAAVAVGRRHASTYGTVGTETTFALADAVAALESGDTDGFRAALMPSGLAAITAALLAFLRPGDHLLVSDSVYGPARVFCDGLLAEFGVETTYFDPTIGQGLDASGEPVFDPAPLEALLRPNTRALYLESPGSYTFEIPDMPALCAFARARGLLTMIDNAWASPLLARPFDWGVDVSIVPLTKYWSGHADTLMGAVVVRDAHWPALWRGVRQLGLCVGGDDAWLMLRGLRTLDVRMARHQRAALAVARWLEGRPEVARVLHPALPSHPQHALWKRDFLGACGLFGFELARSAAPARLAALCEGRRHFRIGYSWGGYESLIMPARIGALRTARPWTGGPLVRLHIGLEDPQALVDDLAEGLDAMTGRAERL